MEFKLKKATGLFVLGEEDIEEHKLDLRIKFIKTEALKLLQTLKRKETNTSSNLTVKVSLASIF